VTRDQQWSGRRMVVFVAVFVVLIAWNLAEFAGIEASRGDRFRAITFSDNGELVEMAMTTNGNLQAWYSLHVTIGEAAPGALIIIPRQAGFSNDRFVSSAYAFGQARDVVRREYDYSLSSTDEVLTTEGRDLWGDRAALPSGPGRTGFDSWVLLVSEDWSPAQTLVAFEIDEEGDSTVVMVDERLLAVNARGVS